MTDTRTPLHTLPDPSAGTAQLSSARLDAMITHAVARPQQSTPTSRGVPAPVVSLAAYRDRKTLFWGGGAGIAIAASLLLALTLNHQSTSSAISANTVSDVSDMLVLDTLDNTV